MSNLIPDIKNFGPLAFVSLFIALVVGVALFRHGPVYYPHVIVETPAKVKVRLDFVDRGRPKADDCQTAATVIADIVRATCPTCQVTMQRCSSKLEAEYERLLSEEPVVMPTFRVPNGVVAYSSTNTEVALVACQETERLTGRNQGYRAICYPPNTPRPLSGSLKWQSADIWQAIFSILILSLISFAFAGYHKYDYDSIKRPFDVVFALLSMILFLPFFLLVPLAIKLIDWRCPVVVSNRAVGKDGRLFQMHKFSTMVSDADKVLADLLARDPAMRKEWEENQKLTNDPRLLPVIGKFLRKFSINELPQLFNVLKGEMAMVGPRPISLEEEAKYEHVGSADLLRLRRSIRPGITGLWQVSGRNNISYRERVLIDADYLQNRSLLLDFKILLKTVVVVVRGAGAY